MSLPSTPTSANKAIKLLKELPKMAEMGISLMGIMPDATHALAGYKIALTKDAQADIANVANETRKLLVDSALLAYGPAVLIPPQHWMYVSQSGAATLGEIEAIVRKEDLLPFSVKEGSRLRMIAARFTTEDQRSVTFYRVADAMMQLKRAKVLGLTRRDNLYGRLELADVLLIRTDFDVVVIEGYAFFCKKATFERAFGFLAELRAQSRDTFNAVTTGLNIQGMDSLREACTSQPQMMAKMASIKRSMDADPTYAEAMTMTMLIQYIEQHPHVDIEIKNDDGERKLVFDPSAHRRYQILKLLDDDFLHSVLTARDYEAGSKVQTGSE